MHIKENRQVPCSFVCFFLFLFVIVMNQSAQERLFTVKAFLFSWPLFVFTKHIFPSDYNCNQSFNMLQGLPQNLTVARLLHNTLTPTRNTVKMLLKNWHFSKETFCLKL